MRARPDAEREREHGHGGEAGVLAQLADGVSKIIHRMSGLLDEWMSGFLDD